MTLPIDLLFVRHGESEGNVATKASKKGDDGYFTPEFLRRHSSEWRLTDKGIWQAQTAGVWIKENISETFDKYYVSEYIRAQETAFYLDLPNAWWTFDPYLREREWGDMDVISESNRQRLYGDSLERRKQTAFFWIPPNGESMAQLCLRIDRVLETLHHTIGIKTAVIVGHGEGMSGFRVRIERLTNAQWYEIDRSKNPFDKIHNCQIIHYSRRNPETGAIYLFMQWMRSICPWDLSLSSNIWQPIVRKRWSNSDLKASIERSPRLYS